MTGKELWEQYRHYTRDFTEHARTLGFGGIAVCWIFRAEDFHFPKLIYISMILYIGYFVADILQSLVSALLIRLFTERQEARLWKETQSIEGEIMKPRWVDYPAAILFTFKAVFLAAGYLFIAFELLRRLLA
jgi:hypothetical protein